MITKRRSDIKKAIKEKPVKVVKVRVLRGSIKADLVTAKGDNFTKDDEFCCTEDQYRNLNSNAKGNPLVLKLTEKPTDDEKKEVLAIIAENREKEEALEQRQKQVASFLSLSPVGV